MDEFFDQIGIAGDLQKEIAEPRKVEEIEIRHGGATTGGDSREEFALRTLLGR
jgi:hypothetical protein